MLSILSVARLQEFSPNGLPLDGGKLYTYELKTTTPKVSYSDIDGTSENTNPIILDTAGSADVYLNGAYTLVLFDKNDIPICSTDVQDSGNDYIESQGGPQFANNTIRSFQNYAQVRSLSTDYAWIYVQGRLTQGDGGQGTFFFDFNETRQDDDGIILDSDATTGKYRRFGFEDIKPEWFGLTYDVSLDQTDYLVLAELNAIKYSLPINIKDSVYINQNYTTTATSWIFSENAKLVSTLGVNFTIGSGGSIISCVPQVFGNSVQLRACPTEIRLSWFDADNDIGRWNKFILGSTDYVLATVDISITLDGTVSSPAYYALNFLDGKYIQFTAATDLTVYQLSDQSSKTNIFRFSNINYIGSMVLPWEVTPEMFGAIGNGSTDDSLALKAALKCSFVKLTNAYLYVSNGTSPVTDREIFLKGDSRISLSVDVIDPSQINPKIIFQGSTTMITNSNITMEGVCFWFKNGNLLINFIPGTNTLKAKDSVFYSDIPTHNISVNYCNFVDCLINSEDLFGILDANNVYYENTRIDDGLVPMLFNNTPKSGFDSLYLPKLPSTNILRTTSAGEVIDAGDTLTVASLTYTTQITSGFTLVSGPTYYTPSLTGTSTYIVDCDGVNVEFDLPIDVEWEGREIKIIADPGSSKTNYVYITNVGYWRPVDSGSIPPTYPPVVFLPRSGTDLGNSSTCKISAFMINGRWAVG